MKKSASRVHRELLKHPALYEAIKHYGRAKKSALLMHDTAVAALDSEGQIQLYAFNAPGNAAKAFAYLAADSRGRHDAISLV